MGLLLCVRSAQTRELLSLLPSFEWRSGLSRSISEPFGDHFRSGCLVETSFALCLGGSRFDLDATWVSCHEYAGGFDPGALTAPLTIALVEARDVELIVTAADACRATGDDRRLGTLPAMGEQARLRSMAISRVVVCWTGCSSLDFATCARSIMFQSSLSLLEGPVCMGALA